jgi:hypothetical protein
LDDCDSIIADLKQMRDAWDEIDHQVMPIANSPAEKLATELDPRNWTVC